MDELNVSLFFAVVAGVIGTFVFVVAALDWRMNQPGKKQDRKR